MTTSKKNELIAEFMGAQIYDVTTDRDEEYDLFTCSAMSDIFAHIDSEDVHEQHYFSPSEMKFDTSWDWLMPVVEKINNTKDKWGNHFDFSIGNGYVWVDPYIGDRIFFSGNEIGHRQEPMIAKVYRGVVAFIQWYETYCKK